MKLLAFEAFPVVDIRQFGSAQLPRGTYENICQKRFAACQRHCPLQGSFIELGADDLDLETDMGSDSALDRDLLNVVADLSLAAEAARPIRLQMIRELIDDARHVTGSARIVVGLPDTSDLLLALEYGESLNSGSLEFHRDRHSSEAGSDDDPLGGWGSAGGHEGSSLLRNRLGCRVGLQVSRQQGIASLPAFPV